MENLRALGGDLEGAVAGVNVPSYVIDPSGVIRWINGAARAIAGDVEGQQFTSIVAPEDRRRAQDFFARKVVGNAKVTDGEFCIIGADGERVLVEISSVPYRRGGQLIGVFGQIPQFTLEGHSFDHPALTPRQLEVLRLLEHGRSTRQIADDLHLSTETVRNHVRGVLRALHVHSRLEAVALARREHLVAN